MCGAEQNSRGCVGLNRAAGGVWGGTEQQGAGAEQTSRGVELKIIARVKLKRTSWAGAEQKRVQGMELNS